MTDYEPRPRDPWEVRNTINCHAAMAAFVAWSDRYKQEPSRGTKAMMIAAWVEAQDWATYGLAIGVDERSIYRDGKLVAQWAVSP